MGWTYVCSTAVGRSFSGVRTEFHIWRCEDPAAPELDTDQTLREEAYGDLLRRGWRNIWMGVPLAAAVLALILWLVWNRPRQYLLDLRASSTPLMLCFYGLLVLHLVSRSVRLIRFTRQLRGEEPAKGGAGAPAGPLGLGPGQGVGVSGAVRADPPGDDREFVPPL